MAAPTIVVFDCDGVLIDSNRMKNDGFGDALKSYPVDIVRDFLIYQMGTFGLSRYRLFDHFFSKFLGREPEGDERDRLLAAFGDYCVVNYPRQPLTEGVREVLDRLQQAGVEMFVCSGSDQEELRAALAEIGIASYFKTILGSPTTKIDNLKAIAAACGDPPMVFVGDAEADCTAAASVGARFIYMSRYTAAPERMAELRDSLGFEEIETLPDLLALEILDLRVH